MSVASSVSVLLTLGFVLALLGISLKLLRRFTKGATGGRFRMEVVQRLSINPKQGIAVVRVGERIVVVSSGDGGVHRLFELEEQEIVEPAAAPATTSSRATPGRTLDVVVSAAPTSMRSSIDFGSIFATVRRSRRIMMIIVTLATLAVTASAALAQDPAAAAAGPTTTAGRILTQGPAAAGKPSASAAVNGPLSKLAPQMDLRVGSGDGLRLSGTVGVVVMMGLLTLLPSLLLMMTGFTRILIVLHFVRQALGTQNAPPTQLIAGLSLLLTGFVMAPTLTKVNQEALQPWMDGKISQTEMLTIGSKPFRAFMLRQTRRQDIETFVRMSGQAGATAETLPIITLTSAFVISELRTAFQMGFAIFLPFIVIDIAVSAVLMSMGMMMLPPAMIALPFKLLLFVLADGWSLVVQSLVTSFR